MVDEVLGRRKHVRELGVLLEIRYECEACYARQHAQGDPYVYSSIIQKPMHKCALCCHHCWVLLLGVARYLFSGEDWSWVVLRSSISKPAAM